MKPNRPPRPSLTPAEQARASIGSRLPAGTPMSTGFEECSARLAQLRRELTDARRERLRHLNAELGPRPATRGADRPITLAELAVRIRYGIPLMIRRENR
jgi:hypothetical protein